MLERNHHSDALCLDMAFFHRPGHLSKPMHGTLCLKFMHFTLCKFYLEKSTINKPWTPLNDNRDQSVLGKKKVYRYLQLTLGCTTRVGLPKEEWLHGQWIYKNCSLLESRCWLYKWLHKSLNFSLCLKMFMIKKNGNMTEIIKGNSWFNFGMRLHLETA